MVEPVQTTGVGPASADPGPTRTCIGCRRTGGRDELSRFVLVNGEVVPDPARRLPSRGAWLHDDQKCRELADRRDAFARAFRIKREG